ncbi:unnamed protein product [Phytophthora lilii]|uniref:Unnamed protein product n=1 Tax=Phytophthora lilii TaxID=2077276 RepID=A0A9W6TDP4_9STRA|nr:unnamed protein product [Phytophthora lilii]
MAKRRNENGQQRREEYEAADDEVTADSFEIGFQRASEDSIRKRKIIKARAGSRPPVASKPTAAGDGEAKSNPFGGFQCRCVMTGTCCCRVRWPDEKGVRLLQDYLKYAGDIATKHASTKPVAINETKRAAPAPFAFGSAPAPAAAASPAPAPSSSSFSFGGADKSSEPAKSSASGGFSFAGTAGKKNDEPAKSPASSGFSFGGSSAAAKKSEDAAKFPAKPASGGFSFGGGGSSLFSAKSSDSEEKVTPAFSLGGLPKPAAPAASTTPASSGFSFGNLSATKSTTPATSGVKPFSFGSSAPAASSAAAATAAGGDEDEETIGREEATVIIKCTFEADKAKIFEFKKDEKRWADKGVHPLKVLVDKESKKARILVRNEIGKIVLNSALYKGMAVRPHEAKGKKTGVTLALQVEGGDLTQFLLKVNAARHDVHDVECPPKCPPSVAICSLPLSPLPSVSPCGGPSLTQHRSCRNVAAALPQLNAHAEGRPPVSPASNSDPSHIRSAVMGAKQQQTEPASPPKGDFLKLFWTLAESERGARTQAAAQLLAHLRRSAEAEAEVQYTLKRLVRGLASSRDAARQGFSTALSALLSAFPQQLALQSTLELLRDAMEVHSSMKPMEQREHMFGRLFGLLALHRSGRLSADLPLLVAVLKELLDMAAFKRWFRETCYEAALTLLADVPAEIFLAELAAPIHNCLQIQPSKGGEDEGVEAWNADQVLLAVGVQRYMHATGIDQDEEQMKQLPENFAAVNALQRHNVHKLARPLRGSSGCYPRVHSAWFGVFGHVLNPTEDKSATLDGELFQEAWTVLVENSLVGGNNAEDSAPTSHERQGLALKLFELVAPKLPAPLLRAILTPRFVKCLYNNAVAKRNYLHEAARHCLKAFAACAPAEFFHFFRKQFASPLSILVTSTSAESDDEEEEEKPKKKKQKLSAGGFDALVELEEKKEREEALKRRTDRARVWAVEAMVAALTELLSAKSEASEETTKLQTDVLRFLVFHSFFVPSGEAKSTPSKKSKKGNKKSKTTADDEVAREAAEATPALSENVANYAKTRLFSLLSLGLAGADGARASASVMSRIFVIAQEMQASSSAVVLREPLSKAQFDALVDHIDTLRSKEEEDEEDTKAKKSATHRPLSEAFLLLFMSAGLQLLDNEQREDAVVVVADLDKCYAQLVARDQKATPTKKKSNKGKKKEQAEPEEAEEESVVVLTDLLLSLLSQDSSALREIVSQVFRSLLPLLNGACLTTMVNVLQPTTEAEGAAADEEDDEFAPVTRREDEEENEDEEEEEEEVVLSSADAVSDALRNDEKLSALHQEDLALAAIVGQVKHRSQRKKDLKRARLQTMHFQLRVLDLLQVFVSQRPEQTEAATAKHNALVLSLVAPLFRVLARVQNADTEKLVLRDRLQAVLLHKVLRAKDKIPSGEAAQAEALDALHQIVELIRTTPMEKDHASKVASAAIVYLVRVICTSEASSDEEVQKIVRASVLDAFTKKHSRFPRASFEELLTKSPAVGARVLLEPLAAVAAASEKKEDAEKSEVRAAVDEFSKCEVFRLLTVLLRGSHKLQQSGELSKAQRSAFKRVQKSLKTALVRQLAPESVQQLKAKRMKLVMMFALQLVKFWHTSEDKKATETDVRAVVAAVQAVDSKSPVVKGMVKQVSEAAGIPFVAANGVKADKKTPAEDEDELMPEHDEEEETQKTKAKKSKGKTKTKTKSPKDKQKKKRKRSVAEE